MNSFSDNVLVKRGRNHGEFFKIVFHAEPVNDVEVCIYRYILPGRVDVYNFSYDFRNGDICFSTDTNTSLRKATAQVCQDLTHPRVVELFADVCSKVEYRRHTATLLQFISTISPVNPSYRAGTRARKRALLKVAKK